MKKVLQTNKAPQAIGPYSQGVIRHGFVFLSGQIALTPDGESHTDKDIREQTKLILDNIGHLLQAAGSSYGDVIKTTVFLTDMNDFSAVNEIYGAYFKLDPPARSCIAVSALPKGAAVEIECIAHAVNG